MLESHGANRTFRAGVVADPQAQPATTEDPQIHPSGYPEDEED